MDHPIVVFLDKDGTLVKDVPYNVDPDKILLEDGAAAGLRRMAAAGCVFVVVSNQSGVARGLFPEEALKIVEENLNKQLKQEAGVSLAGFYYCPHHPEGSEPAYTLECDCRKPRPGMLLRAAEDLKVALADAWMIGDILNDVEAGNRAGCRTILIDNGNETEWHMGPLRNPDFTVANMVEAAEILLAQINVPDPAARPSKAGEP
jgi:D-glycero-D-manno-heptose 1,7-bisphosphate phosphatase